jgi:hypothetical protein
LCVSEPLCAELVYFFRITPSRICKICWYFMICWTSYLCYFCVLCMSQSLSDTLFICCVSFRSMPGHFMSFSDCCRMFDVLLSFLVFCKYWRRLFLIMVILFCVPFPPSPTMPVISPTFLSFARHFVNYTCCVYSILTFPLYIVTSVGLCCVTPWRSRSRTFKLYYIIFF